MLKKDDVGKFLSPDAADSEDAAILDHHFAIAVATGVAKLSSDDNSVNEEQVRRILEEHAVNVPNESTRTLALGRSKTFQTSRCQDKVVDDMNCSSIVTN